MRQLAATTTLVLCVLSLVSVNGFDYVKSAEWGTTGYPLCATNVPHAVQQSPLDIAATLLAQGINSTTKGLEAAVGSEQQTVELGDVTKDSSSASAVGVDMRFSNGLSGGLILGTPTSGDTLKLKIGNELLTLQHVAVHNGIEHSFVADDQTTASTATTTTTNNGQTTANVAQIEMQFVFGASASSTPTVTIVQRIGGSAEPTQQSRSFAQAVLEGVSSSQSSLSKFISQTAPVSMASSSATPQTTEDTSLTLLNTDASVLVMQYNGSLTYPPCTPVETVYVLVDILSVPQALVAAASVASVAQITTRQQYAPQGRELQVLEMKRSAATPVPVLVIQGGPRKNDANEALRYTIIALIATVAALLLFVGVLIAARLQYIELPMWLGGLYKPAVLWKNPPSAHVVVASNSDEESEESEEDEEYHEEEEMEEEELEDLEDEDMSTGSI